MGNSLTLGMDGMPDLQGSTWWSRDGKDHFKIRDIIMDPAQGFIIHTTEGRMLNGSILDKYIQSETPINIPEEAPNPGKINIQGLDEDDGMLPEDVELLNGIVPSVPDRVASSYQTEPSTVNNYNIIDKAFTNVTAPTLSTKLNWEQYPAREFELLEDIMNIDIADIASYIYQKYFRDNIEEQVKNAIAESLNVK